MDQTLDTYTCDRCLYGDTCHEDEICEYFSPFLKEDEDETTDTYIESEREAFILEFNEYMVEAGHEIGE